MEATKFWNDIFARGAEDENSPVEMPNLNDPILQRALKYFGNIEGKTLVDLGCGRGAASLFFAYHGANVISIDLSETAINNLSKHCQDNNIRNVTPTHMPAQEISKLGKVDFVFGSMVLHHIEPFDEFAKHLRSVVSPSGKGIFWENNARSKTMIWFRQNVVGKLWIPKFGDPHEFPLTPSEVDELKKYFHVEIEYPELVLFRMIPMYLFRGKLLGPFNLLDSYLYKYPKVRRYSYRQYLYLS
jgi:2-polyprenyl-3-methyl-5-hydroxy-6-metoxy-1,4-benzoquinol methylase